MSDQEVYIKLLEADLKVACELLVQVQEPLRKKYNSLGTNPSRYSLLGKIEHYLAQPIPQRRV